MKRTVLKFVLLSLIFIGTIATYFVITMDKEVEDDNIMRTATLPITYMQYNGETVNTLHGYTVDMDAKYMRDSITPISEDKTVSIRVETYQNVIAGVSYELRSLDTTRLIEKKNVDEYEIIGTKIQATLNLSRIIEDNEEYLLLVKIVTEKHGEINYYTRVILQNYIDIAEHINFVTGFSESTLDKEDAKEYMPYLEPKASSDNTNLAKVDLYSSFNNVTWGSLEVTRVSAPIITIKELLNDVGCYELNYKVKAKNELGIYEYYNVSEYFRIRQGINVMYLYVYEREMNQIFDCNTRNVSGTRINMGLDSDLYVETNCSKTGSYVSFVKERNLWLMDMSKNQMVCIMSFESGSDSDIRDVFNENDIEIVSTDSSGNVLFMVYGYMNKGEHEGEVGTALYTYNREKNNVKELVFISTNKPFEIQKGQIGKFAYITKDNIIYLMVEDNIYTITMDSNEYVQLANHLQKGNFIINGDNNMVAWHENGSIYSADSIRVIDVAKEKDYKIKAEEGDYIKVIGFVGNDMVYGLCHQSDIYVDEYGDTVFPMYKIFISIYGDEEKIEEYQKDNIYIKDVSIYENMLKLTRVSKDETGNFVNISDDQIVNKVEENNATITQSTIVTDLKLTELIVKFAYTVTCEDELSVIKTNEVEFANVNDIGRDDEYEDSSYYVYAQGHMILKTAKIKEAIETASSQYGVVVDSSGKYVWARLSKLDNKVVPSATDAASPNYQNIKDILDNPNIKALDVSTLKLEDILYYTTKEIPVLTQLEDYGIVAISGYSGYLGNVDTIYFRTFDGTSFNMGINVAENEIIKSGQRYIAILD